MHFCAVSAAEKPLIAHVWNKAICQLERTHRDVTSGGKLRGIDTALSHNALSLVHVHDMGQRCCLALLLSAEGTTETTTSKPSQRHLLGILHVFSILGNRCGHDLRVEQPYTWTRVSAVLPSLVAAAAAARRPSDCPLLLSPPTGLRAFFAADPGSGGWSNPESPPLICNYTTEEKKKERKKNHERVSSVAQMRTNQKCGVMCVEQRRTPAGAVTDAVWGQVGIPAGADGASLSKNHAYGFSQRYALDVKRLEDSAQWAGRRIWFYFFPWQSTYAQYNHYKLNSNMNQRIAACTVQTLPKLSMREAAWKTGLKLILADWWKCTCNILSYYKPISLSYI